MFIEPSTEPDTVNFLVGLGIFNYIVSVIFMVVGFFQQMTLRGNQIFFELRIKTLRKNEVVAKLRLAEFLANNSENLTKLYPAYEKDIFASMPPTDSSQIEMFMTKYPELKFSGLLTKHFDEVNILTQKIYSIKEGINSRLEDLEELMLSDWYLVKKGLPNNIKL